MFTGPMSNLTFKIIQKYIESYWTVEEKNSTRQNTILKGISQGSFIL